MLTARSALLKHPGDGGEGFVCVRSVYPARGVGAGGGGAGGGEEAGGCSLDVRGQGRN